MNAKKDEVSRYEWLAAALGGILFVALIGYFAREAMQPGAATPDVVARVDSITRASAGYVAHVTASNSGGAAVSVRIVGELSLNGTAVEAAEITLELLGRGSSQSAGLYFLRDPSRHELRVRPVSFVLP